MYAILFLQSFFFLLVPVAYSSSILPQRVNQIIIVTHAKITTTPTFYIIFSAKPLGASISQSELSRYLHQQTNPEVLALKFSGKAINKNGRVEYFLGDRFDSQKPWNDGTHFHWQDWGKFAPDIWDNIAIAYEPAKQDSSEVVIANVAVRRGGQLLLDTRRKYSYPSKNRIATNLPNINLYPKKGIYPLLPLRDVMKQFREGYYELSGDILKTAYNDLGQTDKDKYAKRGKNWCSEFAAFVLRENNLDAPDPNKSDVHWRNLYEYFKKNGQIYSCREVDNWPDEKKKRLITPGTIVSMLTNNCNSTHTAIFTQWIPKNEGEISKYTAISGNNKGMVWFHRELSILNEECVQSNNRKILDNFDKKCFFGAHSGH
ncbi:hypothetical protein [Desulfogranum marinum]|uniref:hypothetical protein n=1 Tax=Desulfogranum marinum TaxID=453220 RepID=UPI0029C75437|nr:hypothetical protein [Desulfogranum marinum]